MKTFGFHWHRFFGWFHELAAERMAARFRHHHDRSRDHAERADAICPPEWNRRLWQRDHDDRTENEERRP